MSLHAPRRARGCPFTLAAWKSFTRAFCVLLCFAFGIGQAAAAAHNHSRPRHRHHHARHHRRAHAAGAAAPATTSSAPCTIFVSSNGDSSAAGDSSASPTDLWTAVSQAGPGSVVCLEAGSYDVSSNVMLSNSGSPSAPIVFRNYGGTALLRYTGDSLDGGVLQVANGDGWGGAHDIVIDGLTIDGGDRIGGGIFVTNGAHDVTIENCVIRNTGSSGIESNAADYVTVVHNQIYHAGYNQGWSSGIDIWYGGTSAIYGGATAWYDRAPGFHNIVADNIVSGTYDNSGNHSDGNGIIVDGSGSIPPVLIVNNLVYENGGAGVVVFQNSGDVWVVNNTAYADGLDRSVEGGRAADFVAMNASSVHFVNDLAYGRTGAAYPSGYVYSNDQGSVSLAHDLGFNGSTLGFASSLPRSQYRETNPRLVGPPAVPSGGDPWSHATPPWQIGGDFTLRRHSGARHAGVNPLEASGMSSALAGVMQRYIGTDLAGAQRSGLPDIGAY